MTSTDRCPSPDVVAAFAEGKLTRAEMQPVLAHLDRCARCMHAVDRTNERIAQRESRGRWMVLAAALVLAVLALPAIRFLNRQDRSHVARLVALAPHTARVAEPRLSGGFAWAPYEGPMRSSGSAADPQRLKLAGAAGEIVETANRERSPDAQHAAGVALVLIEQPLDAIERLRAATGRAPDDAKAWSDLAAAQYAAATQLVRASLYPEALASADRALRIDARMPEALFNRALTLERLGLADAARETWQRYLAVDSSSPWAVEAREHERKLGGSTTQTEFLREQPRLERAAAAGDQAAIDAIVARHPQPSRLFAEAEYLGRWGEALLRGDAAAAAGALGVARAIGGALQHRSGEALLAHVVRAIDSADTAARAQMAGAHVAYRRGRIAYSRGVLADGEADLRRAAAAFASAGHPMSLVARYYAANTRFDQNDVAAARAELEALRNEVDGQPGFLALGAQVRWELALCHMINDDWAGALPHLQRARESFATLGETGNLALMEAMLADAMGFVGRPDDAWAARARALALLGRDGRGDRFPVAIGEAARMELRVGRREAARSLLAIEEAAVRKSGSEALLANTLTRKAILDTQLGDAASAAGAIREARAAAQRVPDASSRAWASADADLAEGAALSGADPRRALPLLTNAIDHYRRSDKSFFLPEAYLLRARARRGAGDAAGAEADLESGIAEVEKHRVALAGSVVGTGVLDAGNALFEEAIAGRLDRQDAAGAFLYAERLRGCLAPGSAAARGADDLQRRLAGTSTAVLQLIALRDELVALSVTAGNIAAARTPIARGRLAAIVAANDERQLYDLLLRPTESHRLQARDLVVVADRLFEGVSFAALFDEKTRRYAVESMSVQLAPGASALVATRPASARSIAAIALPSGERSGSSGLPASSAELAEIAGSYAGKTTIAGEEATFDTLSHAAARADVLHVSGHTARQPGAGDAALVFASERVSWRGVAARPVTRARIVILAACETLRAPRAEDVRATSLSGAFLAAGALDVIGTLASVPDEPARAMFTDIHRSLGRGEDANAALRQAQLDALAEERTSRRRTAWRAVALMTRRIPGIAGR